MHLSVSHFFSQKFVFAPPIFLTSLYARVLRCFLLQTVNEESMGLAVSWTVSVRMGDFATQRRDTVAASAIGLDLSAPLRTVSHFRRNTIYKAT